MIAVYNSQGETVGSHVVILKDNDYIKKKIPEKFLGGSFFCVRMIHEGMWGGKNINIILKVKFKVFSGERITC